jgi:hypothetical protein
VTDYSDGLPCLEKSAHKVQRVFIDSQLVGIHDAARQQRIIIFRAGFSSFIASTSYVQYADPTSFIACAGTTRGTNPAVGLIFTCRLKGYTVSLP